MSKFLRYAFFFALLAYKASGAPVALELVARDDQSQQRTLFGIIWICLATIILCAWTAVHPNVPPRNKWKAQWIRLKLMFWMVIAPELVLAWAVRQFFAAKDIRDRYNEWKGVKDWTLSHGYFLLMGGYILMKDSDGKGRLRGSCQLGPLTVEHFKELIKDPFFEFPEITEADIQDRSKGDVLFKLIAILQTSCFIIQCIARGKQNLALTELELVTLALASLNVVTFAIWWHKPLGVQEPVRIYLKIEDAARLGQLGFRNRSPAVEVMPTNDHRDDLSFGGVISRGWEDVKRVADLVPGFFRNPCKDGPIFCLIVLFILLPIGLIYIISFPFFVAFPLGIVLFLRIIKTEPIPKETELIPKETKQIRGLLAAKIVASLKTLRYRLSSAVGKFVGDWLEEIFNEHVGVPPFLFGWFVLLPVLFFLILLFTIFFTPLISILFLVSFIFTAIFGIVTTSTIQPGASHVPSFYAPVTRSDRWSRMIIFALFGVIFGSLHCIGWHFKYPTHPEQTLWRATSLAITVIPLIAAPIDFLLATRLENGPCRNFKRGGLLILDLIMTVLLFIYVPARLSLIAQALALLRDQPPSALVAVDWTKYVPRLFSQ